MARPADAMSGSAFVRALQEDVPAELWLKIWPAERTIIVRAASKATRLALEGLQLPAIVRARQRNLVNTTAGLHKSILEMLSWCQITMLVVASCGLGAQGVGRLSPILLRCLSLSHLDLGHNVLGDEGAEKLAEVLSLCVSLSHLNLANNNIGDRGAVRLSGVLGKCQALSRLDLSKNTIGREGADRLLRALQCSERHWHLDLGGNRTQDDEPGRIMRCKGCGSLDPAHTPVSGHLFYCKQCCKCTLCIFELGSLCLHTELTKLKEPQRRAKKKSGDPGRLE